MATIYVVTWGDYSDYGIHAMFSTKEGAEQYIERRTDAGYGNDFRIEEWELDAVDDKWLRGEVKCWRVWMKIESADVMSVEVYDGHPYDETAGDVARYKGQVNVAFNVVTDTKERAVKVAMERRSIWLANPQEPG